jgi:tetratricopeptide (TPR) repeat protein
MLFSQARNMRFTSKWLVVAFLLGGCSQIPDPNELSSVPGDDRAETAYRILQTAINTLEFKVNAHEISDQTRNDLIQTTAENLLKQVDERQTPPVDAWMLADLYRVTGRWKEAEPIYEKAVRFAASTDRKVNDSLRLAQVLAQNGKVKIAIEKARSVFNVEKDQTAPILPATLYEIVPAGQGKGEDAALAKLLEDAITIHENTDVDKTSEAGRTFLIARPYHIKKALAKIAELSLTSKPSI